MQTLSSSPSFLRAAAPSLPFDADRPPLRAVIACQGGGSWAIGVSEAVQHAIAEVFAQGGEIRAIGGTSGGALAAAAAVKGLNEGRGVAGVKHYSDAVWNRVKNNGALFGLPRWRNVFAFNAEDQWPNIPRSLLSFSDMFNLGQPGVATLAIRDIADHAIGDWTTVRKGPTALLVNSVREHIYTHERKHVIFSGDDLDGDAIAASAGLRELGGHFMMKELNHPQNWLQRNLYRYYDGAEEVNPSVTSLLDYDPTDVIVISLHGAPGTPKSAYEKKLYTEELHYDLTDLLLDDSRRFHLHELALRLPSHWNASSRLNTDPAFLAEIQDRCREQARAWRRNVGDSLGRESTYRPQASVVEHLINTSQLVA